MTEAERLIEAQAAYIAYQRRLIRELERQMQSEHPFVGLSRSMVREVMHVNEPMEGMK